jgi:hypothetical protein
MSIGQQHVTPRSEDATLLRMRFAANALLLSLCTNILSARHPIMQQQTHARTIDLCAQDGTTFPPSNAILYPGKAVPVAVLGLGEPTDIHLSLSFPSNGDDDGRLTFIRSGKALLTTTLEGFEGPYGWVPSGAKGRYIALSWGGNAYVRSTKLFEVAPDGAITENKVLIPRIERQFTTDAHRICRNPGLNTLAIKWIDDDHLLVSINAWASGFCSSNFTEGFILQMSNHSVERKLTEHALINLPAVCTWNLVPVARH